LSAPRGRIVFLAAALVVSTALLRADESAVYRASGPDSRLFDQYDNDGYSMTVAPRSDGSLELLVRGAPNRVVEIPYRFDDRELGESKMSLREAAGYLVQLRDLYWLRLTHPSHRIKDYQQLKR